MKDEAKTKRQLIREITEMRQQVASLKASSEICDALRISEMRYRLLADNISDVVWTMDLCLRFTYFSASVVRLRGYTAEEAMAMTLQETLTPPSYQIATKAIEEELALENKKTKDLHRTRLLELEEVCKDGSTVWVEIKVSFLRNEESEPIEILGVTRNIAERKKYEETIKQMAFFDQLTGLPNRNLFDDRLTTAIHTAHRNRKELAVMVLDLDRFKDINDSFGHAVGDQLLRSVGEQLKGLLRESDTVSRMGGDEFIILLPSISCEGDAAKIAEKIILAFQEPFEINGRALRITASIGICLYPTNGNSNNILINCADNAMYQAKATGRNKWQWFIPSQSISK